MCRKHLPALAVLVAGGLYWALLVPYDIDSTGAISMGATLPLSPLAQCLNVSHNALTGALSSFLVGMPAERSAYGPHLNWEGLKWLKESVYDHMSVLGMIVCPLSSGLNLLSLHGEIHQLVQSNPGILHERVDDPIMFVGPPRTGTSFMFQSLVDTYSDTVRSFRVYDEIEGPLHRRFWGVDVRGPLSKLILVLLKATGLTAVHEIHSIADPYEEAFVIDARPAPFPHFSYWAKGVERDINEHSQNKTALIDDYKWLKVVMQTMQWQDTQAGLRRKRWVLKTPNHYVALAAIRTVFPDATFIITHRPWRDWHSSLFTLTVWLNQLMHGTADIEFVRTVVDKIACDFLNVSVNLPRDVIQLRFGDIVTDPISVMANITKRVGLPPLDEGRLAIATRIVRDRSAMKSKVRIRWGDFGVNRTDLAWGVIARCSGLAI